MPPSIWFALAWSMNQVKRFIRMEFWIRCGPSDQPLDDGLFKPILTRAKRSMN